jgi:hypothetical protein
MAESLFNGSLGSASVDNLFEGSKIPVTIKGATIAEGVGVLSRGSVLGQITLGDAEIASAGAGVEGANTGNGTLTLDATTPILAGAKAGIYKIRIVREAVAAIGETSPAMLAIGQLIDPDGDVLEVFDIAGDSGTTVANQVKFVIIEGSTKFDATDGFNITIEAGSGEYKLVNSANIDGSGVARLILADAVDATSAAVTAECYASGEFNRKALIFGGTDTYATHEEILRKYNIILRENIAY